MRPRETNALELAKDRVNDRRPVERLAVLLKREDTKEMGDAVEQNKNNLAILGTLPIVEVRGPATSSIQILQIWTRWFCFLHMKPFSCAWVLEMSTVRVTGWGAGRLESADLAADLPSRDQVDAPTISFLIITSLTSGRVIQHAIMAVHAHRDSGSPSTLPRLSIWHSFQSMPTCERFPCHVLVSSSLCDTDCHHDARTTARTISRTLQCLLCGEAAACNKDARSYSVAAEYTAILGGTSAAPP